MNSSLLFLSLQEVDDELLHRSEADGKKKNRSVWLRTGAWAACLCLAAALAFPTVRDFLFRKGGEPTDPIAALEYGGKFYEAVDDPATLEKYGLPRALTSDMAGKQLIYLEGDRDHGYRYTAHQTNKALYLYAPSPGEAVYLLRDGETYMAAIFCNFYPFDSNTSCELTELYRIYAIENAADIVSITEVDWHREQVIGTPLTDAAEIAAFYSMTVALWSYGNDDFQKEMFSGFSTEQEQLAAHTAFADDARVLRVETAEGLCFYLSFFPTYCWINSSGAMAYYKMDDLMSLWFDRNFN